MVLIKIEKYINMESLNITHDEERWMFIFSVKASISSTII